MDKNKDGIVESENKFKQRKSASEIFFSRLEYVRAFLQKLDQCKTKQTDRC